MSPTMPDRPAEPTPESTPGPTLESTPAADSEPVRRVRPGWTEIAVGAVGYLAVAAVATLGVVALAGPRPDPVVVTLLSLAVSGVAALGAFGLAYVVRVRALAAFGVRATSLRWLLVGLGGGVLAWLVNRIIVIGYVLGTGDTSNPQGGLLPGATGGALALAATMLLGAVCVPIAEELLFRGVVTTALARYGAWVAVLASALVFAVAHGISIVLPAAFVLGVVNALLLRRSGSVWPGVVAHGVNNALVFASAAIFL